MNDYQALLKIESDRADAARRQRNHQFAQDLADHPAAPQIRQPRGFHFSLRRWLPRFPIPAAQPECLDCPSSTVIRKYS